MGRVQLFDTEAVVRAARAAFWSGGYEDTSLPALERATGLSRSSIYHAFGNKRGLFDAVVDNYLAEVVRPRLRALQAERVGRDDLVDYLTGLGATLAHRGSPVARDGCLLLNAAGSPIGQDPAVGVVIAGYRTELRTAVRRGIEARWPTGAADEHRRLGEAVTALVVAAFVLTRVDPDGAVASVGAAVELVNATA